MEVSCGRVRNVSFEAKMFNRRAANPRYQPNRILDALALQRGQWVADIGSGGGYFTLRFAHVVGPEGRVYAVDTNPNMLNFVKQSVREKGLDNVVPVLVEGDALPLPENSLNLVFMRNVCHHVPHRVTYFQQVKHVLRPDGTVALIEYRRSGLFRRLFGHYIPPETLRTEMKDAGYHIRESFDFLPDQSFTLFTVQTKPPT